MKNTSEIASLYINVYTVLSVSEILTATNLPFSNTVINISDEIHAIRNPRTLICKLNTVPYHQNNLCKPEALRNIS